MATARKRLMELGLAQREAEEFSERSREASLPEGGEVLRTKIARPSQAEDIKAETTPLVDFTEFFLNQIGISSPRQVRGAVQQVIAVNEANTAMLNAAKEKLEIVGRRGAGGIDIDRIQATATALDEAAALMDNPVPEIQQFGREKLQSAVSELDQITLDQSEFLGQQRERIQGQLDSTLELGRQDDRDSSSIIGILNERGDREGTTSKLSVTEKQILANYLGGSNFTQKIGAEGIIPSLSIPFDPSEQITVGDASVLIQAAKKARRFTIADQLGKINGTAVASGFTLADEDGKLTVNEIVSPPLGQAIQQLRFKTPIGEPLTIKPGHPTPEATEESVSNFFDRIGAGVKGIPGVKSSISGVQDLATLFSPSEEGRKARAKLAQPRETN